jgi:hypothetical protein
MTRRRIGIVALPLLLVGIICARVASTQQAGLTPREVREAADTSRELRVIVSVDRRRFWVVSPGGDTLRSAPVAVGTGRTLSAAGRTWRFTTPRGIRRVLTTEIDPVWIQPDWAYAELAKQRKLRLDSVSAIRPRPLSGSRTLVMRGASIGIAEDSGSFVAWPVDKDIIIGGVLFMPPAGSAYRGRRNVLGQYRLNLGGAIGFHGTQDKASIGRAATHGCMRLHDEDVEWLYLNVPVGTVVFIY